MSNKTKYITIFEHTTLKVGLRYGDVIFDNNMLKTLQNHYGESGQDYFILIHNGVKFNSYVGVLQFGNTVIEVLPKSDKSECYDDSAKETWRNNLIGMIKAVDFFNIQTTGNASLQLKHNSLLHFYFEIFIAELESLIHKGLVKKYRKTEGNCKALKGCVIFSKNIQHNIIHKERFYVRYTTYDREHIFHSILYKAIILLKDINTNSNLVSRLGGLILNFPEMPDVKASEELFSKLPFDRKTDPYRNAINIARIILLNYHPNVTRGGEDVLALMFDMNILWEKFVYSSLKRYGKFESINAQCIIKFWHAIDNNRISSSMKPDIILNEGSIDKCIVFDTKWKNINGKSPSPEDLRQIYAYMHYCNAKKVALVYPSDFNSISSGVYLKSCIPEHESSIIKLETNINIQEWQKSISKYISEWAKN